MAHKDKVYNTAALNAQHIRLLFEARDEAYNSCTTVILDSLKSTLILGTLEYFELTPTDVVWVHISVNSDINVVTLIGTITDSSEVKKSPIEVNASPAQSVSGPGPRYIRVSVPLAVIQNGNKQSVLDYFATLEDNDSAMEQQAIASLGKQLGFDLAVLSDSQRERLLLTLNTSSDEAKTQQ